VVTEKDRPDRLAAPAQQPEDQAGQQDRIGERDHGNEG
jgi:hypothetical protein